MPYRDAAVPAARNDRGRTPRRTDRRAPTLRDRRSFRHEGPRGWRRAVRAMVGKARLGACLLPGWLRAYLRAPKLDANAGVHASRLALNVPVSAVKPAGVVVRRTRAERRFVLRGCATRRSTSRWNRAVDRRGVEPEPREFRGPVARRNHDADSVGAERLHDGTGRLPAEVRVTNGGIGQGVAVVHAGQRLFDFLFEVCVVWLWVGCWFFCGLRLVRFDAAPRRHGRGPSGCLRDRVRRAVRLRPQKRRRSVPATARHSSSGNSSGRRGRTADNRA